MFTNNHDNKAQSAANYKYLKNILKDFSEKVSVIRHRNNVYGLQLQ